MAPYRDPAPVLDARLRRTDCLERPAAHARRAGDKAAALERLADATRARAQAPRLRIQAKRRRSDAPDGVKQRLRAPRGPPGGGRSLITSSPIRWRRRR